MAQATVPINIPSLLVSGAYADFGKVESPEDLWATLCSVRPMSESDQGNSNDLFFSVKRIGGEFFLRGTRHFIGTLDKGYIIDLERAFDLFKKCQQDLLPKIAVEIAAYNKRIARLENRNRENPAHTYDFLTKRTFEDGTSCIWCPSIGKRLCDAHCWESKEAQHTQMLSIRIKIMEDQVRDVRKVLNGRSNGTVTALSGYRNPLSDYTK